jgi:hypothetical protein
MAVSWDDEQRQYRCGALVAPADVLGVMLPESIGGLARFLAPMLPALAKRWIAAGEGCDSTVEWTPVEPDVGAPNSQTMTAKD